VHPFSLSEVDQLTLVAMKHPRDAFIEASKIDAEWQGLGFSAPPDLARARAECDAFMEALTAAGAEVMLLPRDDRTTLDSVYVRDASIMAPEGVIFCTMGKPQRTGEPAAQERAFVELGIPTVGRIEPPGTLEGGDVLWLDARTLAVGRGYRTNAEGVRQLRGLVGEAVEVVEVPLPHWRGASDVMHLMSLVSPVDHDLAVVYSPLLPVPFRQWLADRLTFVEVPDDEFETMATNVLALGPRRCLMLDGNPRTRRLLERAGCAVHTCGGTEISVKGAGGPTCLTRPLVRTPGRVEKVD